MLKDATTCQVLWETGKTVCSNLHPMGDQVQLTPDYSGIKTGKILAKTMLHFFFLFRKYLIMTVTFCIKGIGKAKLKKRLADLLHLFHL